MATVLIIRDTEFQDFYHVNSSNRYDLITDLEKFLVTVLDNYDTPVFMNGVDILQGEIHA